MELYLDKSFSIDFGTKLEEAKVVLFGIPFDSSATGVPGTKFGPMAFRNAFLTKESADAGIEIYDAGNLVVVPGCFDKTSGRVKDTIKRFKERSKSFPVFLGGEHSITLPIVQEIKPDVVISLDAHMDMKNDFQGNKFSHSCVMRRIYEDKKDVILVGSRAFSSEEIEFVQSKKIQVLEKGDIDKINKMCAGRTVYLSIDIDILDPAFAPGTGTPEAGGWTSKELKEFLQKLHVNLVGIDIVEINPLVDPANLSGHAGAAILMELLRKIK